jgi:hypothetical protein
MSRPFPRFIFSSKPDLLMSSGTIEPRLIKGDNELPILMFDKAELAQYLV